MASYRGTYEVQITDINGDVATVRFPTWNADSTTLAALATSLGSMVTVLAAATNGKVTRQGFSFLVNEAQFLVGSTPPTDAEYSSVTDGARMNFADGNGARSSVTIPAPIEALFGANSNVVDPTNGVAAAFITAYEANCSRGGVALNLYKGGVKVGRGSRVRRSALIP